MKTVAVIFFLCSSTSSLAETSHQSVLSFTKKLLEHIEEENFEAFLQAAPCKEIKEKLKEVTFQELVQEFSDSDRPKTVEKMLRDLPKMTPFYATTDTVWFELDKSKYEHRYVLFSKEDGEWCLKN